MKLQKSSIGDLKQMQIPHNERYRKKYELNKRDEMNIKEGKK
jgi:hypothetical protein